MSEPAAAEATPALLSICIPTHKRPQMFERALRSVLDGNAAFSDRLEIIVSDNAPDDGQPVFDRLAPSWPGRIRYVGHRPSLGAIGNFNRCIEEATGRYLLILHDDDYLLPGGVERILSVIAGREDRTILFGVDVVDADGHARRHQTFPSRMRLDPPHALRRLLTDSSFVRVPAVVIRRDAFEVTGVYDPTVGNPTDFDLLIRLFSRFGVACEPAKVAAYTVHEDASTTSMFHEATIGTLMDIFERAARTGLLSRQRVRKCQVQWFHQFLLGGTYRRLRAHDRDGAKEIMSLFKLPSVRELGHSRRWLPIRAAFVALLAAPEVASNAVIDVARRFEGAIWLSW